ncbi:MAG TPA: helix-turn-helix domain-containing protein [Solirubrobacteraceae bacterium]|nr:helix-turn-helix domain-containing protein [Solirubrobacteraceae bacterium]
MATTRSEKVAPGSGTLPVIAARLRGRRGEIEESIVTAVLNAGEGPVADDDPDVTTESREMVAILVESLLVGIERGVPWPDPAPSAASGYRAIRAGVHLRTGVRRNLLAHALLLDYLLEEVSSSGDMTTDRVAFVKDVWLAGHAALASRLSAMTEAYVLEARQSALTYDQRRLQLAKDLLAGRRVDAESLSHPLDVLHVGIVASGVGAAEPIKVVGARLGSRVLVLSHVDGVVWAWLSGRERLRTDEMTRRLAADAPAHAKIGVGEPAEGPGGFRLTYRQANAALSVAELRTDPVTRYADAALLAHAVQDATLARSLIDVYLAPLGTSRQGGDVLRNTLRAYFNAGRNGSAAAVVLKVDRSTVRHRLDAVEERLGHSLYSQQAELEVALALEQLHLTAPLECDDGNIAVEMRP